MSLIWKNVCFEGHNGSLATRFLRGFSCACCMKQSPGLKILSNLNGEIKLKELTALMGPSGAGKSTLLKCITQGKSYSGFQGQLYVDVPNVRACFITQVETDHLLRNLEVYESMWYASEMKNHDINSKTRALIIDNLLHDMNLEARRDNLVGKCSGGEKKKIAIALELTAEPKPNFLFLDEPTTSLDSFSGYHMIKMMRQLAMTQNIGIVASIHQPSLEIVQLFHKIYVISKEGNCIFSGHSDHIKNHLLSHGYPQIDGCNPADGIIKIGSSVNRPNRIKEIEIQLQTIVPDPVGVLSDEVTEKIKNKAICKQMSNKVYMELTSHDNDPSIYHRQIQEDGLCKNRANFSFWNLWVLFKRSCWTSLFRQKKLIFIRFLLHAVVAALLATLYNRDIGKEDGCYIPNYKFDMKNTSCVESEEEMRNESVSRQNVKFQFFSLLFLMFAALMPTVLSFPAEIKLFLNEHRNGWYNTVSYYVSKTIVEIPCQLILPYFYTFFLCWFSQQLGMDKWYGGLFGFMTWRYSYFLGIILISCFIAQGLGFLIGIICVNSFNITVVLSSSVLLFLFLFSGFFVRTIQMDAYVQWITYLSFIRFSFESLLIIIYGFDRCKFVLGPEGQQIPAASAILYTFDLKDEDLLTNLYWLIAHLAVSRILAFIVLKTVADPKFLRLDRLVPVWVPFVTDGWSGWSACRKNSLYISIFIIICLSLALIFYVGIDIIVLAFKSF